MRETVADFLLLAGAGLLVSSVLHLENERLGFDVRGIAAASVEMPQGYSTLESREAFERTLRERLRAMPRVKGVAFEYFPPNADGGEEQIEVQGQADEKVF